MTKIHSHECNLYVIYQCFPWAAGSSIWLSQICWPPTGTMHQICYHFWNKGSQPELMSTLGIRPFSLLGTSLAALICADGRSFFTPVCHNAVPDQKQGYCPRQGHGDKVQLGKCHLLGKQALWEQCAHCLQRSTATSILLHKATCQTQLVARPQAFAKSCIWHKGLQKDRGAAVVCGTNVKEYALLHNVPGQRSQARVLKWDGDHDGM